MTKNFPLRLDNNHYDRLSTYAKQMKISVNTAINWAIDEFCSQIQQYTTREYKNNIDTTLVEKPDKTNVAYESDEYKLFLNTKIECLQSKDFIKYCPKMSTRTINILKYYLDDKTISEINKKEFLVCRNAGKTSWKNFCVSVNRLDEM